MLSLRHLSDTRVEMSSTQVDILERRSEESQG